ncbi:CRISPR-associated protein Cas1 [Salmonella enterica subsp. enterica serovar Heidelberg str. RI-11-014316]|nr:CRISPR-associated protein Cas1 [Salmonella enterica subsp. enterica serovar Heidelberg str. RI-11-014316]
MTFVPLNPIPLKDRTSMIFLQYGQIDVLDGAFVLIDKTGSARIFPLVRSLVSCWNRERGFPMRLCVWHRRWERCWCGWARRECGFIPPDNPAAHEPISCFIRQSWR